MRQPPALAKITRPRIHGAVARERLFTVLDDRSAQSLVWIAGPPGAGKTTLVSTWLTARRIPGIWFQVDGGDVDPSSFFYYLALAAAGAGGRKQRPLPLLTPEYLQDLVGFTRRFGRALFARLPEGAALVLDNYQEAPDGASLHQIVSGLVGEIAPGRMLIGISRADPPVQLARHLAAPTPQIVDWAALRLTVDEAVELVGGRVEAEAAAIAAMHEQAGGWAAGLTLLADQFARTGQVEALRRKENLERVFDYFASQVFAAARPALREFLMRTAFLARMTPAMAREMSGETAAARWLEDLCRRHLFTERRVAETVTYQYHALFRAFLLLQARERDTTAEVRALQRRAASVLEAGGQIEDAVNAFIDAQEWQHATRMIVGAARDLLRQGRGQTLREWVALVPADQARRDPWLLYWAGTSLIPVDRLAAREKLEQAFALFEGCGELAGQAMAAAGVIETHFSEMVRFSQMDPWIEALDRVLALRPTFPEDDAELSVYAAILIGTLYRQPAHPLLQASVERVRSLLESGADSVRRLTGATYLLVYCIYTGEIDLARQVIIRGEQLAAGEHMGALALGLWSAWQGHFYQLVRELPAGLRALDRARDVAREHGLTHIEFLSLYFRAGSLAHHRRWSEAAECLARMEAIVDPKRRHLVALLCSRRGWLAMLQGKPTLALQQGKPAFELAAELGSPSYRMHWGTAYVYGLLETGRRDEAQRLIAEARQGVAGTAIKCFEPFLLCLEARCAELEGDRPQCLTLVRRMFEAANGTSYGYYLAWLQPYLPAYAAMALQAGIETDYVCELIRMAGWSSPSSHAENWPWRWKVYSLGRFETVREDKPLEFGRKAPKKPLALLRALIALGEIGVPEQDLIDYLWPDEEGDAARKALATALHRLRALLGSADVIELSEGRLSLDTSRVWVDCRAFVTLLSEAEEARRHADEVRGRELMQRALDLYRGAFLPQDADAPWAISTRERLRSRFIQHVAAVGERWEAEARLDLAIACYQRGLEADDLAEPLYQGLMRCYAVLNRHAEAWSTYRRLRQTLSVTLGIAPSPDSEALARKLLAR